MKFDLGVFILYTCHLQYEFIILRYYIEIQEKERGVR